MLTPLPAQNWTSVTAGHLLNRAGFGATPAEVDAAEKAGLAATVEQLLRPPNEPEEDGVELPWTTPDNFRERKQEMRALKSDPAGNRREVRKLRRERRDEMVDLGAWWLQRMRETRAPLVEKMTLFWHGHFATSAVKVKHAFWMWYQNHTFRRLALGNFKRLLRAITRDPAMMIYLDLAQSEKAHPNENWARELMELFTLGIGHYSEEDIRESARAFTGYRIHLQRQPFRFVESLHDPGRKNFLGHSGNFKGDDILDIITQQPACPEFIGRKLCRFFVTDEPSPALVDAVAASLRQEDYELTPVLRALFSSAEFYSDRVIRTQIKSPIQFLIQTCKLLDRDLPSKGIMQGALRQMGQIPLVPPNVKGWDGGKSWISTSTLLFRYNFANYLLNGTEGHPNAPAEMRRKPLDLGEIVPEELRKNPQALIATLAHRFYQAPPTPAQESTFLAYLKSRAPDRSDETIRRLLHLMMSTPQYQLT